MADRGAQGAGRRGAHVRADDVEGGRRLRALPRHPLAGLRRRRGRAGVDQPGRRRDRRAARHVRRHARGDLLLLHLGRAHRGRREHDARRRAQAVAQVGRGRVRQRLAEAPLGPDPHDLSRRGPQAARAREGPLQGHQGGPARLVAAHRRGRRDRLRRAHARGRRDAARALRAVRLVGLLHVDQDACYAAAPPAPETGGAVPVVARVPIIAGLAGHVVPARMGARVPSSAAPAGAGSRSTRPPRAAAAATASACRRPACTACSTRATRGPPCACVSPRRRAPASRRRRPACRRPRARTCTRS